MPSKSSRRAFFSLLNLLLALFLAASLVSAAAHDEGADIASALLAAADGDTSIDDTDRPSSQPTSHASTSMALTNMQAANMNSTKQKGYSDTNASSSSSSQQQQSTFTTTSTRKRPASVMGMAAVVPICTIFITLFVVAMRLYLNRIEDEEEFLLDKRPWHLDANDERFEIGGNRKEMGYAGPTR